MKTNFFLTISSCLIMAASTLPAQPAQTDFKTSRIRVSTESGAVVSENTFAVIKLNTNSQEMDISSCILFDINDSATGKSEQASMTINFKGQFPIENLDFYDVANDKNIHTMSGELTVNNITRAYKMNFGLHGPSSINVYTQDKRSYTAQISFAIEIDVDEFDLDVPPSYAKTFIIAIKDGVINKTNEYDLGPECIGSVNER
ncbi:MAG: hypothetical protein WAQ28_04630 [Bacteroidia bacterium]